MPPVFAQPTPIPRFGYGGGGGNYAALAGDLQRRYSDDADRALRAQLGFAELGQRQQAQQQDYELHAAQISMQPVLQQQAADLHLQSWMAQQQFTKADQQELAQQNTALSELQDKLDKGEIDRGEFYQMIGKVAPRIDYLKAKEQHNRNQAIAEYRKQQAEEFQARKNQLDQHMAFNQLELEGKIDYHIPPQYRGRIADMMRDAHPEAQSGTSEYDELSKGIAAEMGWAVRAAKKADGSLILDPKATGMGETGTGATGERGGRIDPQKHATEAVQMAAKHFADLGKQPSGEELKAKAVEFANAMNGVTESLQGSPQQLAKQRSEATKAAVSKADLDIQNYRDMPGLSPDERRYAINNASEAKRLIEKYGGGPMPSQIKKRIDLLAQQDKAFNDTLAMRQKFQPNPATPAPAPEARPAVPESSFLDLGVALPMQAAGRLGRGVENVYQGAINLPATLSSLFE